MLDSISTARVSSPGVGGWRGGTVGGWGAGGPRRAEPSQVGASGSLLKINSAGALKHQHRLKRRCLNDTCASHPAASARHTEAAGGPALLHALRQGEKGKKKKPYACIYVYIIKGDGNDRSQTGFKLTGAPLKPRSRYRPDDRHSRLNWPSCAASHFPTTTTAASSATAAAAHPKKDRKKNKSGSASLAVGGVGAPSKAHLN